MRDVYEMELVNLCLARGKPVLGVCRGAQVLNVALGGTLYQDIELEHEHQAKQVHRIWEIYDQHAHEITVEPGSWLERWYGAERQRGAGQQRPPPGHRKLGRDLVVEARSIPDGIVEAVRYQPGGETRALVAYGVQWHPEFMQPAAATATDPAMLDSAGPAARLSARGGSPA